MVDEDTYSIVKEKIPDGKTFCSLCSRLRRGILYRVAHELGCKVIALGHHRDDILQTLLLNLMFAGQLAAMPPKLAGDGGRIRVVRPLVYCAEEDIQAFSDAQAFPILPCDLCGSQSDFQRKIVGEMINRVGAEASGHQGRDARRGAERPPEPSPRPAPLVRARSANRPRRPRRRKL
jgi:tRNA 2-thiocytidine biosynthesis protein TtcA